ncbi:MAG: PepSY domain-containing protein, partial [Clostridia bacterium]|nr:PepSY domain-containing protein [Clostridia bacterium]
KTLIITALLCVACFAVGAVASGVVRTIQAELRPDFTVIIDGEEKIFKNANGEIVEPILYDGTTYLPVRAIGELMGKTVYWYEDEKVIELKDAKTTVTDADVIVPSGSNKKEEAHDTSEKPVKPDDAKKDDTSKKEFIGEEKAKEIVLEKAGLKAEDVRFDRVELDKDNGVWHYEVEFKHGYTEYSADVNATDGSVRDYEVDIDD